MAKAKLAHGKATKDGYRVTGIERSGKRGLITVAHSRREALDVAKRAKARGVKGVRIEVNHPDRSTERELDRDREIRKAQRRGRIG